MLHLCITSLSPHVPSPGAGQIPDQMVEQKDLSSLPLMKTPKSQLTAEKPSRKQTESYQKRQEEAATRWKEGHFHNISNPTPTRSVTHRPENNYIRGSPTEVRVPNPKSDSPLGCLAFGRGVPGAFCIEDYQGLCVGIPQVWEKPRLYSCRVHTRFQVHWLSGQTGTP